MPSTSATGAPTDVPLSLNCTEPVGAPSPGAATATPTVAVKVTAWPKTDGFTDNVTEVLVPALTTVTVVVAVAVLPDASPAVNVTVVSPTANSAGASLDIVGTASHTSLAIGSGMVTAVPLTDDTVAVIGPGMLMNPGGVVSPTLT